MRARVHLSGLDASSLWSVCVVRGRGLDILALSKRCQDVVRFAQSEKPCEKEVNGESAAAKHQQPASREPEGVLAGWSRKKLTCCIHQAANSGSQNTGNEQ